MSDEELTHHGIMGMHWGRRRGTSEGSSTSSGPRTRLERVLTPPKLHKITPRIAKWTPKNMHKTVSSFKKEEVWTGRNIARGILLGYALIGVHAALTHLSNNPIKIHIDYTRPPFKKAVEPFFKATVKKVIPNFFLEGNMINELTHHGVMGMHWGRRRGSSGSSGSADHQTAHSLKGKKLEDMSNDEIKIIANRLSLERQYKDALKTQVNPGQRIAKEILGNAGKQVATKLVADAMTGGVVALGKAIVNKKKG